jgi:hypothetical protein
MKAARLWRVARVFGFAALGGTTLGIGAFLLGYFGSMFFMPRSNIGPLLGFFTGPVGVAVGLLCGGIYGAQRETRRPAVSSPN